MAATWSGVPKDEGRRCEWASSWDSGAIAGDKDEGVSGPLAGTPAETRERVLVSGVVGVVGYAG